MNNWNGAVERKTKALLHVQQMEQEHILEIMQSRDKTIWYDGTAVQGHVVFPKIPAKQIVIDMDCCSAVRSARAAFPDKKIALVNFASYTEPGGRFLDGSMAQEEAICHESTLYNVLSANPDWYTPHQKQGRMDGLYTDQAIYTPDIWFEGDVMADVITCAAPNRNYFIKWAHRSDVETVDAAMFQRIAFICRIAEQAHVDILIFGAFGCGVFANIPETVARYSAKIFGGGAIPLVSYAIPGKNSANFMAFSRIVQEYEELR